MTIAIHAVLFGFWAVAPAMALGQPILATSNGIMVVLACLTFDWAIDHS